MKKISVIIPIFDTEEFLQECLNSVSNQTYSNLEIILINDGSKESCKEVIEQLSLADPRIQCHHLTERKGVGAARNFGLTKATGEYVYFLDSDDFIPSNTLQLLIEHIGDDDILSGIIKSTTKREESLEDPQNEVVLTDPMKSFNNYSMLNRLISRNFIQEHKITFSEEVDCYSEIPFILPLMIHLKATPTLSNCVYFHRKRNDPISNPSLMQLERIKKVEDFLYIYNQMKDTYQSVSLVNRFLDQELITFYRKVIVMLFNDYRSMSALFDKLSLSVNKINFNTALQMNPYIKQELNALRRGSQKQFVALAKTHHLLRGLKGAATSRRKLYTFLYRNIFSRLPLKEKTIVFESFLGKNYSDSPKNIYEYLLEKSTDHKCVWIFNEKREIPGNAKQIKRFSLPYYYYMATSKYWVSNSRIPMALDKREGNVYLQTWHGTPLKKLVFDQNDIHSANPHYKSHFYKQSRRWDYLISANQYSSDIFKRAFKFDKEMLEFGYPRNDILHSDKKEELSVQIKEKLGLPLDKKVILYAPTWRDDEFYEPGKYKFKLSLDLQEMRKTLGDEYVILLRMHYFIADNIETTGAEDFAYNLSKYNDIADLYLISDVLITDYSSVFFDYANLKRPILFYTYDLEKYRDTLRGFYIDMEKELPGPLLKTTEEIIQSIQKIDQVNEQYREEYDRFYEKICGWEKGNATEQVVKRVFNI